MTTEEIENATLEAIYWWNRDEHYYHSYFSQLDTIYRNKNTRDFFIQKIVEMFTREYAVRRNLKSGPNILNEFMTELFENKFFETVVNGDLSTIDRVSENLKKNDRSANRHTRSLLSKVAFLINPHQFYLYDNLAKNSIKEINTNSTGLKVQEIKNYTEFVEQTEQLRESIASQGFFVHARTVLDEFDDTLAYHFFSNPNHQKAFEMRIVDKYLWIYAQKEDTRFNNTIYLDFHKMQNKI